MIRRRTAVNVVMIDFGGFDFDIGRDANPIDPRAGRGVVLEPVKGSFVHAALGVQFAIGINHGRSLPGNFPKERAIRFGIFGGIENRPSR